MRIDGRRVNELRPVRMTPNFVIYPEGSVLITVGNTQVICNVTLEPGIPRWMQSQDNQTGWVTAEYAMPPRSTQERIPRETKGLGGRTQEIRRLVGRSLRAAEGQPFSRQLFNSLLDLASQSIGDLLEIQNRALE